jgi:hypothetical protein
MNARFSLIAATALVSLTMGGTAMAQQNATSFFVTSVGSGKGADLGGLAGADAHCQSLAQAAGAGAKTWRAYLSAHATANSPVVNARDRIGNGPWQNAKGVVIAKSVDELHGANNITKQTALTEKGDVVNGRGDTPNEHDALTGSTAEGRAFPANLSLTCGNWTSSTFGSAELGHTDRQGLSDTDIAKSWNSSHMSRSCSQPDLVATGGAGRFYCFATN